MTTLAEHIIVARAENRPPMLEKSLYDSWASPIEENRQTRLMKYSELTKAQQLQDDYDVQVTNIILYGLSPDVYALVNHQEGKVIWQDSVQSQRGKRMLRGSVKILLVKAQRNGKVLNDEELEFLAHPVLTANLSSYRSYVLSEIRPMLYDDNVIAKKTNVILIADSEETLMLEEESRSKMLLKQSDPMVLENKFNIKPINYAELN
nr:hypothetical protein [Tanacetum cinerariifolium]